MQLDINWPLCRVCRKPLQFRGQPDYLWAALEKAGAVEAFDETICRSCQGDTGGWIMCYDENAEAELIGSMPPDGELVQISEHFYGYILGYRHRGQWMAFRGDHLRHEFPFSTDCHVVYWRRLELKDEPKR